MSEFEGELDPIIVTNPDTPLGSLLKDVFAHEGVSQEIRIIVPDHEDLPISFFAKVSRENGVHYLTLSEFNNEQLRMHFKKSLDLFHIAQDIEPRGFKIPYEPA